MLKKFIVSSREELVYEAIKDSILKGEYKPKETVNQSEVARQLGVSIIPVRSAISRLIAEGLLSQESYHSAQVSALSKQELEEVLFISLNLETLATREAVPHIGPAEVEKLKRLLDEMDAALEKNELLEYGYLNRAFHRTIYENCPYPRLRQMITDLWNVADIHRYRAMFDLVPELAGHSQDEHRRLVGLIEAGQVDEAVRLMEDHKAYSRNCYLVAFEELKK